MYIHVPCLHKLAKSYDEGLVMSTVGQEAFLGGPTEK